MDLGIVYHIEDAHQFWAELEDIVSTSASSSLSQLDASLRHFVSFCASFHQQYLQTPVQLEHAVSLLLDSEIFAYHSDRLSNIVISDALSTTDPHVQLILYHVLLQYGRRHVSFLRNQKKWVDLIPLLMDHITLVDVDFDLGLVGSSSWRGGGQTGASVPVPIEARLRMLAVMILYEVCRVQKFDKVQLEVFSDEFVDHLFELVEGTRDMPDETLNYCVIKLIIALNEQFMVAALPPNKEDAKEHAVMENRVIRVLMRRLGSSKTFGENLIFMLNRADRSAEDRCMQLLILKILYLLFTTPGTQEYFYTNDLCVLVDVFIREIDDFDDDNESLRHTYLRVLHPLLTHTQLRTISYKRPLILRTLESLIAHAQIRDINPTTKRLVERCLSGEWAVQLKKEREAVAARSGATSPDGMSVGSDSVSDGQSVTAESMMQMQQGRLSQSQAQAPHPLKDLKFSKSMDVLTLQRREKEREREAVRGTVTLEDAGAQTGKKGKTKPRQKVLVSAQQEHAQQRRGSNDSYLSLMSVAGAGASPSSAATNRSSTSTITSVLTPSSPPQRFAFSPSPPSPLDIESLSISSSPKYHAHANANTIRVYSSSTSDLPVPATPIFEDPPELVTKPPVQKHRRPPPAPPVGVPWRKPPAVPSRSMKPVFKTGVQTIKSSVGVHGKSG